MVWSQSLVPVASVLLILGPSLLVLFLYYVETIWHLSVYLHLTLELDPKIWLLELGIQNSLTLTHCSAPVHLSSWLSFFLWVLPTWWQYSNTYRNRECRKAWRLVPQQWWKCIIYGNCLLKLPCALFKLATSVYVLPARPQLWDFSNVYVLLNLVFQKLTF